MKTICALATAPMNSAIHIIRVSGNDTYKIINRLSSFPVKKQSYAIQRVSLVWNNKTIDNVLLMKFIAPKSYTGEDLIEINCHGGIYLANKIIDILVACGCQLAEPGEFTRRAFMNNKLTINEADAINNIINASNDKAIDLANNTFNKQVIKALNKFKEELFKLIGQVEVNIDYPEFDDIPNINKKTFLKKIDDLIKEAELIVKNSRIIKPIKDGVNVALIGRPNVGKSSLMNALLDEQRVIVSSVPGTTRDVVSSKVNINGLTFNVMDTAGIRKTTDQLENISIDMTNNAINNAQIIIWLVDGSQKLNDEDKKIKSLLKDKKYLVVINKSDLKRKVNIKGIKISAKNNQIDLLIKTLWKYASHIGDVNLNNPILQSDRSIELMMNIVEQLQGVKDLIHQKMTLDLAIEYLHHAMNSLMGILGNGKEYNFVDQLFKNFCVGK
ncbi:MAG: tRNA uridine-5-carboxymethylaminomethyl(34) synthesis GTPase MnmE [Mycoplasmataceae bacterium]|nr:tRNA uridine-5-carboxymethylaminomethyl(34) synthesis GTPase MnmE [Mycoplasmataceae bacterium]